ncbi:MAG: acetylxylan esterase, partial [Chloroflexi bacterium]|nr:acetylxylan esterase [Chloroflexota bacterium]
MPLFDLPLSELEAYRPARTEPKDFDAFWQRTLQAARAFPLAPKFAPINTG